MADTYWLSFRLADRGKWAASYNTRYDDLHETIKQAATGGKWWLETSSFYLFSSEESIDAIVNRIKKAIAEEADLAVVGKTEYKTGRVIGNCQDPDIFHLVPFMKKV